MRQLERIRRIPSAVRSVMVFVFAPLRKLLFAQLSEIRLPETKKPRTTLRRARLFIVWQA